MSPRWTAGIFTGLALLATGCTNEPAPISGPTAFQLQPQAQVDDPPLLGVGTLGTVDEIKPQEQGLVLYQTGFDFVPAPGAKYRDVRHEFAVGSRHNKLQVHVDSSTRIHLNGDSTKKLGDLKPGDQLLVVGRLTGSSLHAETITDLGALGPPPANVNSIVPPYRGVARSNPGVAGGLGVQTTSLCMGQDLDYADPSILEFQGCWGGPSAADDINTPFIPLMCPLIGCFGLDRFSYTMALAGWGFAFPMQFGASAPGLTYHVPGTVSLGVTPLQATVGSFSFWGGLGFDIGLNIDFCSFFGCYDIYTFHLSAFSTAHQATGAAPFTGQHLDIQEVSCPTIGLIPIEGIPIDPIELGLCEDLGLDGKPFTSTVAATGASPGLWQRIGFGPAGSTVTVRPDAMSVGIRYDDFEYIPDLTAGLAFEISLFSFSVYTTPTIPFGRGPFHAVTNPFPMAGSVFTVATDPLSPVNDLWYLFQPTAAQLNLSVAPASTALGLVSSPFLAEGTPVVAHLAEAYDGAPIAGQPVTFQANGLGGTASVTVTATTNSAGNAAVTLPNGEYGVTARFGGAAMYLPSTASASPVYVYRPSSFVIWAGNPGGVTQGGRYQFWGSGWAKQITGGGFNGNPSFQGFGIPLDAATWSSPPAGSGRAPDAVPDLISVILTTAVTGRGSATTGNIAGYAVVRVQSPEAYRPGGGHDMWGVMRARLP